MKYYLLSGGKDATPREEMFKKVGKLLLKHQRDNRVAHWSITLQSHTSSANFISSRFMFE